MTPICLDMIQSPLLDKNQYSSLSFDISLHPSQRGSVRINHSQDYWFSLPHESTTEVSLYQTLAIVEHNSYSSVDILDLLSITILQLKPFSQGLTITLTEFIRLSAFIFLNFLKSLQK